MRNGTQKIQYSEEAYPAGEIYRYRGQSLRGAHPGRSFVSFAAREEKKQQKVNNHQTLVAVEIAIIGSEMDFDFDRKTKKHASG